MRASDSVVDQHSRIPLTVIAGAAGAGKSALARHLIERTVGRRVVAIVSDESLIDRSAIARRDGARLVLNNGCVCMVAEDGASALAAVARHAERPEHVIIDAHGSADPRRLAGYGYMPGYHLDGTVVVLDVASVRRTATDIDAESHLEEQIRVADVIVLNKVDVTGEREAVAAHATLKRLAPNTPIVWSEHARVAPALMLGLPDGPTALDDRAVLAEWAVDYVPFQSRGSGQGRNGASATGGGAGERRGDRHRAWCLTHDGPIDARSFRDWVHHLPRTIVHGRGILHFREEPQHRQVFHLFGAHWRVERGSPWGPDAPFTRLLLAGLGGPRLGPDHDGEAA